MASTWEIITFQQHFWHRLFSREEHSKTKIKKMLSKKKKKKSHKKSRVVHEENIFENKTLFCYMMRVINK